MPTALITGVTGQDGSHLAELLLGKGYAVHGLVRTTNPRRDLAGQVATGVRLHHGDLTDPRSLDRTLRDSDPDEVYNLGALPRVASTSDNAELTRTVTSKGVLNLLEAIRRHVGDAPGHVRFFQASSAEMFGTVDPTPRDETAALAPRTPYGLAKAFGHQLTVNYREVFGLHASSGILGAHESPRGASEVLARQLSRAVASIVLGQHDHVVLRDLDTPREWGFAGDHVEAMWLVLQQPEADDYVIATGESHSVREFLDLAFDFVRISDWSPFVRHEERPGDPEIDPFVGDSRKARDVLGWTARTSFAELVAMMVDAELSGPVPAGRAGSRRTRSW